VPRRPAGHLFNSEGDVFTAEMRLSHKTFEQVSKRTGVGTGPCGGRRCGTLVRGMLGEPVINCAECGWPV
jgi:hypothetical protein